MPLEHQPAENRRRFQSGEHFFRQGDYSRDLYIVQFGRVRIYKVEAGVEIELDTVGPGGVIGEVAAIDGGSRSASAAALETTEAIVITAQRFAGVLPKIPDWFRKISLMLVKRLRSVDAKIHNTLDGENTRHVAVFLSLMGEVSPARETDVGIVLPRKYVEDEFLDIFHMPLSEIETALNGVAEEGLIKLGREEITISDLEKTREFGSSIYRTTEIPAT